MSQAPVAWGDILARSVPPVWASLLGEETLERVRAIGDRLSERVGTERIVPAPQHVFRALQTPPDQVRVLIVGQDPYPTAGHAMGLSFSVPESVWPLPPSADNIRRELVDDLGLSLPSHGSLLAWVKQGVLLLNRHLTTAEGSPGAHHHLGWDLVTTRIIEVLVQRQQQWVAILWGKEAQSLRPVLGAVPRIESAHPSPLSAYRGFFGSKPFSRANELLRELGQEPVDWTLDPAPSCTPT